jgi:uncharacterized protein (DUF58 family)
MDGALKSLMQLRKRRCLAFVLSDFQTKGYEKTLKQVARRHELVCVQIEDPAERTLPKAGLVWYQDRESGERVLVDSCDRWIQNEWPQQREQEQKLWQRDMKRAGASVLTLSTTDNTADALHRFLSLGSRRRS